MLDAVLLLEDGGTIGLGEVDLKGPTRPVTAPRDCTVVGLVIWTDGANPLVLKVAPENLHTGDIYTITEILLT